VQKEIAMRTVCKLTLVTLALSGAGVAAAADYITVPTSTPASLPLNDAAGFDWSGFYAGLYGGLQNSPAGDLQAGLGVMAGVNAQFDYYLLGAEIAVQGIAGGTVGTSYGQILGRAGLVVSDDVAVFAAGGYGLDLGPPEEEDVLIGGGVELAVMENLSVRAQYLRGFPVEGDNPKDQFTLGAAFHF
jgi:outer membrane immunogenic protein